MSSIVNANRLPALFFGIFFFMQIFLLHGNSQAQDIFKITTRTTDKTNTLSADEKQVLDDSLYAIEKNTGRQVVVVLIPSTGSQSIEDYATELFRENGIGDKERNDGVLILVAKEDRKMRIEVGYGLEGTITDLLASKIIEEQMKPLFRAEKYDQGLMAAVSSIENLLNGQELPPPKSGGLTKFGEGTFWILAIAFVAGLFVGTKSITFKYPLLIALIAGVLVVISYRIPELFLMFLFGIFPFGGGYMITAIKWVRILFFSFIVCLALLIGFAYNDHQILFPGILILIGVFFFILVILLALQAQKNEVSVGSGGWSSGGSSSSSSSSSWSSSSSSSSGSSFSGGGGSSGGGGASGSW